MTQVDNDKNILNIDAPNAFGYNCDANQTKRVDYGFGTCKTKWWNWKHWSTWYWYNNASRMSTADITSINTYKHVHTPNVLKLQQQPDMALLKYKVTLRVVSKWIEETAFRCLKCKLSTEVRCNDIQYSKKCCTFCSDGH